MAPELPIRLVMTYPPSEADGEWESRTVDTAASEEEGRQMLEIYRLTHGDGIGLHLEDEFGEGIL